MKAINYIKDNISLIISLLALFTAGLAYYDQSRTPILLLREATAIERRDHFHDQLIDPPEVYSTIIIENRGNAVAKDVNVVLDGLVSKEQSVRLDPPIKFSKSNNEHILYISIPRIDSESTIEINIWDKWFYKGRLPAITGPKLFTSGDLGYQLYIDCSEGSSIGQYVIIQEEKSYKNNSETEKKHNKPNTTTPVS